MNNFNYYNPTKIVFGKDSIEKLRDELPKEAKKILFHYGKESIKKSGLYEKVVDILESEGVEVIELSGVEPNPSLDLVRQGIQICKDSKVDFILAVGGGSVIDSAKAIAAGVCYGNDVWELFTEGKEIIEALPMGVILTIPAAGSESSSATVISNRETKEKLGLESDLLRPKFALLNPELTLTLPQHQTFAGVVDILSHVMERYFTHTKNVDLTDALCEGTMKTVIENAYKLLQDPNDYDARAEIMLCGTMSHSGILGVGRDEDWASHRIAHQITALYGTTHGVTLSIIFPAWMKYVYTENISRFARFAKQVLNVSTDEKTDQETALLGIEKFESFLKDIDMPVSVKQEGVSDTDFEIMAEKCTNSGTIGSFKRLSKRDVIEILKLAN